MSEKLELVYGVFDESMLSLRRRPADTICESLPEAMREAMGMVQDGPERAQAAIYVCRYFPKEDEAYPLEERGCITISASDNWTPISDDDEEVTA